MPTYTKLKVAELRELCQQRNINHACLTKRQLTDVLRNNGNASDPPVGEGDDSHVDQEASEEEDVELGPGAESLGGSGSVINGLTNPGAGSPQQDSVMALRLRLEIIQAEQEAREQEWETEKECISLQANGSQNVHSVILRSCTMRFITYCLFG